MNDNHMRAIKADIKAVKIKLKNKHTKDKLKNKLEDGNFNHEEFKEVIDLYEKNIDKIGTNDYELGEIKKRLMNFLDKARDTNSINNNYETLLDDINYLIENVPKDEQTKSNEPVDISSKTSSLDIHKQLEEERVKNIGRFKELEEKLEKRESEFKKVSELLEKSSKLEENYSNAESSVLRNIELQKSYKFWKSQAKSYELKYAIYLVFSIALALFLLIFAFNYLDSNPLIIVENSIEKIQLSKYAYLFFLTTLVIWLIRILIKITLSNYHLSVDANERVIMIRTYLALLKEGKGFEEKDKKVILDNIFRPTNFGIIKDETSVTIADIVSSFKSK